MGIETSYHLQSKQESSEKIASSPSSEGDNSGQIAGNKDEKNIAVPSGKREKKILFLTNFEGFKGESGAPIFVFTEDGDVLLVGTRSGGAEKRVNIPLLFKDISNWIQEKTYLKNFVDFEEK